MCLCIIAKDPAVRDMGWTKQQKNVGAKFLKRLAGVAGRVGWWCLTAKRQEENFRDLEKF